MSHDGNELSIDFYGKMYAQAAEDEIAEQKAHPEKFAKCPFCNSLIMPTAYQCDYEFNEYWCGTMVDGGDCETKQSRRCIKTIHDREVKKLQNEIDTLKNL